MPDTPSVEWWRYLDENEEGGVLKFGFQLELHVYRRLEEDEPTVVWLNHEGSSSGRTRVLLA